ncbi:MAG: hypothetical protein J07HQW1_01922 [Haloquadratum walsbyi J07HQW1]|uniref:Uncharacterized protein n=1 Tax=Haloquadratum walsbyi J07HQW1 TaxID=1238424 RepID=U1N648_9EURY|nr:MAG: hypothetical protein J07HQW1_01922 [Haloquadratum walsbyi J07HQW1]
MAEIPPVVWNGPAWAFIQSVSDATGVSGGQNRLSQQRDVDGHPSDQRRFYRKVRVESGMLTNY